MSNNGDRMDRFEAGLDRLKERHEALTETVEIVAGMQRRNEEAITRLESMVERVVGAVEGLVQIAQSHERRLDHLEGN
ncbi:MAG: hypothetical protein ACKV22_34560 [Bryobacteraceae bacterium]